MAQSFDGKTPKFVRLDYSSAATTVERQRALVNNQLLSDVVFIVCETKRRIYAHKTILVMASKYFYGMFCGGFAESKAVEVVLSEEDPDMFLVILNYIYGGEIDITHENFGDIYDMAQMFLLTELIKQLRDFLKDSIMPENALHQLSVNRYYGFDCVDEKCLRLIRANAIYYFYHKDLKTVDYESLRMIIGSKKINCTDNQLERALHFWGSYPEKTDERHQLSKMIKDGSRTHNCIELRLFGSRFFDGCTGQSYFSFSIESVENVSLYGVGVFIRSTLPVNVIKVCVYDHHLLVRVGDGTFAIADMLPSAKHVVNLFFKEIVLMPHHHYNIAIKMSPNTLVNRYFGIVNPWLDHDTIKLRT